LAEKEIYRCPNCGALLPNENATACEYCGAVLVDKPRFTRSDKRYGLHERKTFFFKNLPSTPITIDTQTIPFKPEINYTGLPGGTLDPSLRRDADEIVSLVEKTQKACNEEDLNLVMTTISPLPEDSVFYNNAKKGATEQFISGDMKRYTVRIDFLTLTENIARIDNTFEAIIFLDTGQVNQIEITFAWHLKKVDNRWKIYNSIPKIPKIIGLGPLKTRGCIIAIVSIVIALITVGVSILLIFLSSSDEEEKGRGDVQYEYKGGYTIQKEITGDDDKVTMDTPIILYKERDLQTEPSKIILSRRDYKIIRDEGDWVYIKTEDGDEGWTLKVMLEAQNQ